MASSSLWQRFQRQFVYYRDLHFSLDVSRMQFPRDFLEKMQPKIGKAFAAMRELEAVAIANPTEKRMVGYYWLRSPALAPTPELRTEIEQTINRVKKFAADIHAGKAATDSSPGATLICGSLLARERLALPAYLFLKPLFSRTRVLMCPIYGR